MLSWKYVGTNVFSFQGKMVIVFQWFTFNKCHWIKFICQILLTRKNRKNLKVPFFLHLWHFSVSRCYQLYQYSIVNQMFLYKLPLRILKCFTKELLFQSWQHFTFAPNFCGEWHKKVEKCSSSGSLKLNLFFKFKSDQLSTFLTSV